MLTVLKCIIQWHQWDSQCCVTICPNFTIRQKLYLFSNPHNLVTSNLLSASMNLPILGTLYKWNLAVLIFLFLADFSYPNVFKVQPCCNNISDHVYQDFIPFYD